MNQRLNFICVGFQKSGTTTLDSVLRQHSQIKLPLIKETQYFHWKFRYNDSKLIFWNRFFSKEKARVVGVVEPEFDFFAEEIRKTFGKNVKLIFIMRNPLTRLFSFFRMELKRGDKLIWSCYGKHLSVAKMFECFVNEQIVANKGNINPYVERGKYMKCIQQFLRFFPRENMKFIIFEDFIRNPEEVIKDLQTFLQVDYEELDCNMIENKGNQISKNFGCLFANYLISKAEFFLRCNKNLPISLFNMASPLFDKLRSCLTVENKEKMNNKTKKICEDFYRADKQELEKFLQRDLSGIWFA